MCLQLLILYFSGTGNTRFIAERLSDALTDRNHVVELQSIERYRPSDFEKFDMMLLGYPVYACDMPKFLTEYLRKLPLTKPMKIITFSTLGFYGGNAARKVGKRLYSLGMIPMYSREIRMPGSDGLIFLNKDSKTVHSLQTRDFNAFPPIKKAIADIVEETEKARMNQKVFVAPMKMGALLTGGLLRFLYTAIERHMKRKLWATDACTQCQLCAQICPSGNITVLPSAVQFGSVCFLCMRCVNQCPSEAIQIGSATRGKFRWKGPGGNFRPTGNSIFKPLP